MAQERNVVTVADVKQLLDQFAASRAGKPREDVGAEYGDLLLYLILLASRPGVRSGRLIFPGEHPPAIREALRERIESAWSHVDAHLAANGPYMLGAEFSGVDLLALMYMRWSRNMPRPVTEWPALKSLADRLRQRASWKRLCEIEGLTEWAS